MSNTSNRQLVSRFFTGGHSVMGVLNAVEWETRITEVKSSKGEIVFSNRDVGGFEVPKAWSRLAGDIAAEKYARKAGASNLEAGRETSFKQVIYRVVNKIAQAGSRLGYFGGSDEGEAAFEAVETFKAELAHLLVHQMGAFNSPVWFNVGLDAYGCEGGAGNFTVDAGVCAESPGDYTRPQASACFILSREDTLEDIYAGVAEESRVFKGGSGAGSNFSKIRGKNEFLSSGGRSSGLLKFMEVYDRAAGATKSGGTTRRAAKMLILNEDHPEILDFIRYKANEEKKAKILIENGYESNFNGEAYSTVGGQNGNNSVRVTSTFMEKATEGTGTYDLKERTTGNTCGVLNARDVLTEMAQAAHACGCPGIQFDTTINAWNPVSASGRINASNPCSEFMFLDDTACNLASLNLLKFYNVNSRKFDFRGFRHACRIFILAQDILVSLSSYPTKEIAENSVAFRPLGLGYANLATMLLHMGIGYGTPEAQSVTGCVTSMMTGYAYEMSSDIADHMWSFSAYDKNKKEFLDVLRDHQASAVGLTGPHLDLLREARAAWDFVSKENIQIRNAQVTVLAPTGTIGLLMDCQTTGIEPVLSFSMKKELAGGGMVYIVLGTLVEAGMKALVPSITKEGLGAVMEFMEANGHLPPAYDHLKGVFLTSLENGEGKSLHWKDHLSMMAAAQPFLSGAISKTVNLPNSATVDDVRTVYIEAWKMGLKAVAIYRDGCKESQPLTSMSKQKDVPAVAALPVLETPRRQKMPTVAQKSVDRYEFDVGNQRIYLLVGLSSEGKPLEIFLKGPKMGGDLLSLLDCWCVSMSFGLQHGVPLGTYIKAFSFIRFSPQGSVVGHPNVKFASSVVDAIMRILGFHYLGREDLVHVLDNVEVTETQEVPELPKSRASDAPFCSNCGHQTVRNGSCYRCLNCGSSEGCS